MRNRFIGMILLFWILYCQQATFAAVDKQYWTNIGLTKILSQRYQLDFSEEIKWGNHYSEMFLHRTDINLGINVSPRLRMAFAVKQINVKSEIWSQIRSSYVDIQLTLGKQTLQLKDRNRFEYRINKDTENVYRYRNKLTLSTSTMVFGKILKPYIADEIFYDINIDLLKFNRFYTGLQFMVGKSLKTDLFYLLEHKKGGSNYMTHHILGTTLRYIF